MRPIRMLLAVLMLTFASAAPALAQAPDDATLEEAPPAPDIFAADDATVLALGKVLVSEVNWAQTPDPEAIAEVLRGRQRARGDAAMLDTIRAYSSRATGVAPSNLIRMRWISTLRLDAGEPAGWALLNRARALRGDLPLPWSNFEGRWRARLDEARDLLTEAPPSTCDAPPPSLGRYLPRPDFHRME